jgi:hypothetical protein
MTKQASPKYAPAASGKPGAVQPSMSVIPGAVIGLPGSSHRTSGGLSSGRERSRNQPFAGGQDCLMIALAAKSATTRKNEKKGGMR